MSAATPERRPFRVPARGAGDGADGLAEAAAPGPHAVRQSDTPASELPLAENPWHSVYQNAGLAPSFGQYAHNAHKLNSESLEALEAQHNSAPRGGRSVRIQDDGRVGTPMSASLSAQRMDGTSRENCRSVYEYLTTRAPTARHSQFSGSRLGTRGDTGASALDAQGMADGSKVTPSTIMYQKTSDEMGKFTKKKKEMTAEEAQEYLDNAKRSPLKPPKTYWEQDDMRQQMIQSLAGEICSEDAPGGSWVVRPGTIPASRAMMKDPDRLVPMPILNPDKRKMLCNLRWQLYVQKIFNSEDLIALFSKYDQDRSRHISMNLFLHLLKNTGFELTAVRVATLEEMFRSETRKDDVDYEAFTHCLMQASKDVPKPPTYDTDGMDLRERNRKSAIFDGLTSMRPKSQSGRVHTYTDIKNQLERPLVLQAGNQTTRSMYQFMSERETIILHNYRDRDPLRETYKPQSLSFDPEPPEIPGRSLPKRIPTPKMHLKSEASEAEAAAENAAANAVVEDVGGVPRDISTPSKARGRTVDFILVPSSPNAEEQTGSYTLASWTPGKAAPQAAELRSPANVVDAATNFGYYEVQVSARGSPRTSPVPESKGGKREIPATGIPAYKKQSGAVQASPQRKKHALMQLRPPSWEVASRYQVRPADMLKKLSHLDPDGLNQPAMWASTNGCNQDIPGGADARAELKETLAANQKANASKRLTNWSYAHSGNELNPSDWSSTTRQQMLRMPRLRTPKKHFGSVQELREPPWSVAERHQVHLQRYDHRLVGLRRPEPLAKSAP